jgi:UrcA family protein
MTPTSTGRRGLIAAAIFCVLAPSLNSVSAAEPDSASRIVRFADLNLSDPSGAHALYMRIRAAAQVACGYYWFATDWDKARCVLDATADAVTKINEPALSAVFNARNRTSRPTSLASQRR